MMSFAKQRRETLKEHDTIYIVEKNGTPWKFLYYITISKDVPCYKNICIYSIYIFMVEE